MLTGHRATTQWQDIADLSERFPAIQAVPGRFVIDCGRVTSGGTLPALGLTLELPRHGPSLALAVASAFIYGRAHRGTEPQPMRAAGRLARQDPKLTRVIRLPERHLEAKLSVAALAERASAHQPTPQHHTSDAKGPSRHNA